MSPRTADKGTGPSVAAWAFPLAWLLITLNVLVLGGLIVMANGVADLGSALLLASFAIPGGLLALKRPDNLEAWMLLIIGTTWSLAFITPFEGGWAIPLGLMGTQLLLRFPNGTLLASPWWQCFSTASLCYLLLLTFVLSTGGPVNEGGGTNAYYISWVPPSLAILILLFPVVIGISVFSLVRRFRRAASVEREQIRWITWAAATSGVLYSVTLLASIGSDWGAGAPPLLSVLQAAALLSFCLLPMSIYVAVLKYRLFDIDRIISRTTSYVVVTGLLLATYGAVVATLTRLVPGSSSLAVAAATLAAAAAFRPLLRRVQLRVDARFNRERYDAVKTVEQFASDLRQIVDPDVVIDDLLAVVGHTLEPTTVRLWIPGGQGPPAR
jgi:hypothetical protein